jgi:type I restriction-modification system DNA methylase subunit
MKLSKETKDLIRKEYDEFKESMYAGKTLQERQELDQFFTPPEISILLIEELTDLSGNILDPTCGSGNLLAAALLAGADSDKVFGNELDKDMIPVCLNRLNKICKQLGKDTIKDWQIHQGNALISDCLTEFSPDYNDTVLSILKTPRRDNKNSDRDNHITYTLLDRPDEELYLREKQIIAEKAIAPDISKFF